MTFAHALYYRMPVLLYVSECVHKSYVNQMIYPLLPLIPSSLPPHSSIPSHFFPHLSRFLFILPLSPFLSISSPLFSSVSSGDSKPASLDNHMGPHVRWMRGEASRVTECLELDPLGGGRGRGYQERVCANGTCQEIMSVIPLLS